MTERYLVRLDIISLMLLLPLEKAMDGLPGTIKVPHGMIEDKGPHCLISIPYYPSQPPYHPPKAPLISRRG